MRRFLRLMKSVQFAGKPGPARACSRGLPPFSAYPRMFPLWRQQVFPLVEFESFPHAAYFVEKFPASVRKFFIVGWAGLRLCGTGENQVTYLQVGDGAAVRARLGVDFTAQAQGPLPSFVARPGVSHQGRVQLVSHDDDGIVPELRGEGRGLVDDSQRYHDERIVFRNQEAVPLQFLNDPFRMVYLRRRAVFSAAGAFSSVFL